MSSEVIPIPPAAAGRVNARALISTPYSGEVGCDRCGLRLPEVEAVGGCPRCASEGVYVNLRTVFHAYDPVAAFDPTQPGQFGWRAGFPLPREAAVVSLGEGNTATVDLPGEAARLGVAAVAVKDESRNPTWSYKDRLAAVAVSRALTDGADTVVVATTGNHGAAVAAYAAAAGLRCVILTAASASPVMLAQMLAYGAKVIALPTAADRWTVMSVAVREHGWFPVSSFQSPPVGSTPLGIDGYKAIAFELHRDLGCGPDVVVVPTAYGDGLAGIHRGFVELHAAGRIDRVPRMVAAEPLGTLAAFATFAAGFLVRPIGGAIAGHFGDRVGRRKMLMITVLVMGGSSTIIGLLPTYNQIGYWAAVLLVIMRMAQGLAIGGEWSGAILLAIEQAKGGKKTGLLGSFPQAGNAVGLLLATGSFTLVSSLSTQEQLLGWAWRLPFLASVVLLVVGLVLRSSLTETPQFEKLVESGAGPERLPLLTVLRSQPRNFLLSMGSRLGVDISFYVFTVYSISYGATALGLPSSTVQIGLFIGAGLGIFTAPLFGWLADRFGVRRTYVLGLAFIGLFAFPFFAMLGVRNTVVTWIALVLAYAVGIMAGWAPFAAFLSRLFPARVRYSGTAFSFQLAGTPRWRIRPHDRCRAIRGIRHPVRRRELPRARLCDQHHLLAVGPVRPGRRRRTDRGKGLIPRRGIILIETPDREEQCHEHQGREVPGVVDGPGLRGAPGVRRRPRAGHQRHPPAHRT
ncbi:pyridoxal-phosphate dependent enzyme [Saccharopolyspora sp. ASAGF58]|uniref:pyridoxal-phosphate dependent enzyme n=1 Tax=Saccharopolyspora sp. ASAGF58 TaxID=2719023 RepID=UPI001FF0D13E|nr:pyridoxal-phosphate dependent enzyme [Saccharopolyspora sp. ASAGF58]